MNRSFCIILLICLTGAFQAGFSQPERGEASCTDTGCHANLLEQEVLHSPAEDDCETCHEASGQPHPQSPGTEFSLTGAMPDLCYDCHDSYDGKSFIHTPVKNGECTGCHSPHASDYEKLLLVDPAKLCFSCHGGSRPGAEAANIQLKVEYKEFVHEPAADGDCSACHQTHAADYPYLLSEAFPKGNYATGEADTYTLCFGCHDSDLLEKPTTTTTNFRNARENLHYLHLNGEKGRNCIVCHDAHGSDFSHIIAGKIRFGEWMMPLNYVAKKDGGSCLPGCHAKLSYRR